MLVIDNFIWSKCQIIYLRVINLINDINVFFVGIILDIFFFHRNFPGTKTLSIWFINYQIIARKIQKNKITVNK